MKKITAITLILSGWFSAGIAQTDFDGDRAMSYLKKQVAFGPRTPGSTGHQACLDYLTKFFEKRCDRVKLQAFTHQDKLRDEQFQLTNVIASFNPQANQRIFLAAHWDTRPWADMDKKENRDKPIPGANDGASGVAVLMEIANQLKIKGPALGVDLILFDGEDSGREGHLDEYFLGSRYFAKNNKNYHPRYGVLLDMVGDANLSLPKEQHSFGNLPQVVNKIWSLANSLGHYAFEDRIGLSISDDHVELLKYGIPCIDVIDFEYPDRSHRYWHTLQDTPDKCSAASLNTVGQVMLSLIYMEY